MSDGRGNIEVEDLLKIILVLVGLWLVLEVVGAVLSLTLGFLRILPELVGLLVVALIVLWLLDRI